MPKPPPSHPVPPPPPSLWPPRRLIVSLCSLAAAVTLVRAGWLETVVGSVIDGAVRNIITLILAFAALVSVVLWFLRESGHPASRKRALGYTLLGLVAAGLATLRIERVSGDLVPQFRFAWQKSRDTLLARPAAKGAAGREAAVPWQASRDDFPRFLGPAGDASLPASAPVPDPDWRTNPPRELWRREIGAGWSGFATFGGHAVTLEQRGEQEIVTCLALDTGEPEWQVAVSARHQTVLGGIGPRSTPTIHDGVVYAAGATGWLHAIDGASGKVLWKKDVLADLGIDPAGHALAVAWGRSASALVRGDEVIVPAGGPRRDGAVALVAYDRSSGERRWTAGVDQISYASPAILEVAGRAFLVLVTEGHVVGFDPDSHEELWRFPWPGHSQSDASCSQPVVIGPNRLFVSKGYGIGCAAFDLAPGVDGGWTATEAWSNKTAMKTKFTNVALHDGHLYGLSDGILECLRAADGKRMWKKGRYDQGQLLRAGDLLVVQSEPGDVVLVEATPEAHREVARLAALSDQTWNNPALVGDLLLVRNAVEAACYRIPVRGGAVEGSAVEGNGAEPVPAPDRAPAAGTSPEGPAGAGA